MRPSEEASVRRSRFVRPLAFALGAILALSGCVPSTSDDSEFPAIDPEAMALVEQLRSLPFDERSVEIVSDVLTSAGVAIATDWDPDASEVVRITPWQMQNMAVEAANEGGVTGAELEAVAETPDGVPPIGYLISAWAIDFDSDGARIAHALLGDQDFHHPEAILFPGLVTTLFLADATADYDASQYQAAGARGSLTVTTTGYPDSRSAGVCSAVSNFIQRAIATVVNALKVDTSGGGFFGFLGKIWNRVVDLATGFVTGLIEAITRPVVQLIVTIFGALETIRQLSTYLVAWRSTLEPKPDTNVFGIDDAKIHGRVTLTVLDNRIPIPESVLECSDLFGVNLRDAGSAAGSAVSWTATNMARPDLSRLDSAEDVLDRNQIAQYDYVTGQESAKTATGEEHAGLLKLVSSVHRNDIEKIRKLFTALVFDQVPSSIRGIVESIAGPILDAATNHLTSITDVRSTGYVAITFHGEKPDEGVAATEPPGDGGGGSGCPGGLLAWLNARMANSGGTVTAIPPAQFVSDYAGVLPDVSDGQLPTCAFQITYDVGVGHEVGYFVGAGKPLVQHALAVMAAAGYEGETTSSGGFVMDDVGRQCAAVYVPRESAALDPDVPFPDQFVEITGPPIASL
jgi:hypothetical protein